MSAETALRRVGFGWALALALASGLPAIGAVRAGVPDLALALVVVALAWPLAHRFRPHWPLATVALLALSLVLMLAGYSGIAGGWLLMGMTAALAAWDLDGLRAQMRGAHLEAPGLLLHLHVRRLAVVCTAALLLGGLALNVRLRLSFAIMFVLALIVFLLLSAIVRRLLDR